MPGDKWDQYQEQSQDKWGQYADQSQPAYDPYKEIPDARDPNVFAKAASDTIQGIGEGALNTIHGTGELLRRGGNAIHAGLGDKIIPPVGQSALGKIATPDNTMQAIGKGAEQIGEFLIPGIGEEAGIAKGTRAAPLIKAGINALDTGIRNKLQGGDFGNGVLGGAGGEALGAGLKKAAPAIAESAMGITKRQRGYGKTPGTAILEDTKGLLPSSIEKSAGQKLSGLTSDIENMASRHQGRIDLTPALDVIDNEISKAQAQNNESAINQLKNVRKALTVDVKTGRPLPQDQSAWKALNLKRGLRNQFITNWNPETLSGTRAIAANASGAIDKGLDTALGPEFASKNQRISSLIPVQDNAESLGRNAGIGQRVAHRIAAHTGAGLGAVTGGTVGYQQRGIPGAVVGGTIGLVAPELATSPFAEMGLARAAHSGILPKILSGSGLQLDRGKRKERESQ